MNKRHQVHNLIVLDESGSMEAIKIPTLEGFNKIVQTIKEIEVSFPDQEHFISLVSFNGIARKIHHWKERANLLQQLNTGNYQPDSSTPLFDAIGVSMDELATELTGGKSYSVLVTIFTDGEENASVEYSGERLKKLIEDRKNKNWTFSYIGTDHDVDKIAKAISINNVMKFDKNTGSLQEIFNKESDARYNYSCRINKSQDSKGNYY